VEGTLIEQDSTQVEVDNVMKDLERRLDEDSFVQVPGEKQIHAFAFAFRLCAKNDLGKCI
jgi:hypothetical protein